MANAKHIFLFDGNNIKRGVDDGRVRVPLTPLELQSIHRDPEVPHSSLDNSITGSIHMSKYDEVLLPMESGDCIYLITCPDMMGYRGLWVLPQDGLPGLKATFSLVNAMEVHKAICDDTDPCDATTYGDDLTVDFELGLGANPCSAPSMALMEGETWRDFRHPVAFQGAYFDNPWMAQGDQATYLRMMVDEFDEDEMNNGCSECSSEQGLPYFQYGVIIDDFGVRKTEIPDFCSCEKKICAGCAPCDDPCEQ